MLCNERKGVSNFVDSFNIPEIIDLNIVTKE